MDKLACPEHLSLKSRALWNEWAGKRVTSAGRIEALRIGLEAMDRADSCREIIDKEGLTIVSKRGKMPHNHPLLKEELSSRRLFHKIIHGMGLDWEYSRDGVIWEKSGTD